MRRQETRQVRGIVLSVSIQGGDGGGAVAERCVESRPERGALPLPARMAKNLGGAGPGGGPRALVGGGIVHHDHGTVGPDRLDDPAQGGDFVEDRHHGPDAGHYATASRPGPAPRAEPEARRTRATWAPPRARP